MGGGGGEGGVGIQIIKLKVGVETTQCTPKFSINPK